MKTNKGFSLVELIVVIAIMAIIAGVAIPVYQIYIDKAEKGNDIALVGEVLNAIDLAINSGTIKPDDSYQLGMGTLPIGFIVINESGAQIINSNISVSYEDAAKTPCDFETVEFTYLKYETVEVDCKENANTHNSKDGSYSKGTPVTGSVTYCKAHTPESHYPKKLTEAKSYYSGHTITKTCGGGWFGCDMAWEKTSAEIPVGTYYGESTNLKQASKANPQICEAAYAALNGTISTVTPETEGPIYEALVNAFGSLENIKLSYDGWSSEGDQTYATIYPYAGGLMNDLSDLAQSMVNLTNLPLVGGAAADKLGVEHAYTSTDDMVSVVSDNFSTKYAGKYSDWKSAWDKAATTGFDQYGFGFSFKANTPGGGRENFLALIRLYNECLAGYLQSNGINDANIINAVREYGENMLFDGSNIKLPIVVNSTTATGSKVKDNGTVYGALENVTSTQKQDALDLIAKYPKTEASYANAKAVYDLMMNISATHEEAKKPENGGFNNYYNQYVGKVSEFFESAQTAAGDGILIILTSENGVVSYNVSPYTANPREK